MARAKVRARLQLHLHLDLPNLSQSLLHPHRPLRRRRQTLMFLNRAAKVSLRKRTAIRLRINHAVRQNPLRKAYRHNQRTKLLRSTMLDSQCLRQHRLQYPSRSIPRNQDQARGLVQRWRQASLRRSLHARLLFLTKQGQLRTRAGWFLFLLPRQNHWCFLMEALCTAALADGSGK